MAHKCQFHRLLINCGIGVKNYDNVQVADQIECFERIEVARTLD